MSSADSSPAESGDLSHQSFLRLQPGHMGNNQENEVGGSANPIIHFLRCPECSFMTVHKKRFESHFPCALHDEPTRYFLYVCDLCKGMCTDRGIMEEHKDLYHRSRQVTILESTEYIKPLGPLGLQNGVSHALTSSTPSLNTLNAAASLSKMAMAPHTHGSPFLFGQPISCPMCKAVCLGPEDLVSHLQLAHANTVHSHLPTPSGPVSSGPPSVPLALTSGALVSSGGGPTGGQNSWLPSLPGLGGAHLCGICTAVFRTPRQLENHITAVHPRVAHVSGSFPHIQAAILASAAAAEQKHIPLPLVPSITPVSKQVDDMTPSPVEAKRMRMYDGGRETNLNVSPLEQPSNGSGSIPRSSNGSSNNMEGLAGTIVNNGMVHNTLRKTKSDMKVIRRYLLHVKGEQREIDTIPAEELSKYLQDFVLTARKKDGNEYEPESLKAFIHSLERHLKYHNYPASVLKDTQFSSTRTILQQRLMELRAVSRASGAVSKASHAMTTHELIGAGILGAENPQALLNTLWLINRTYFNIGGTQRHKSLLWGQFQIVTSGDGEDYLQYAPSVGHEDTRFFKGGINPGNPDQLPFDCVEIVRIYANMRPVEARSPHDSFYLCPDQSWEQGGAWFRPISVGVQQLAKIPKYLGLKTRESTGGAVSCGDSVTGDLREDEESHAGPESSPGASPLPDSGPLKIDQDEQEEAVDMSATGLVTS